MHRNVCQLLLEHGVFGEEDLIDRLGDCIDRHKQDAKRLKIKRHDDESRNQQQLGKVVDQVNAQLEPLQLKVARMRSKISGEWLTYYGVVNLNEDDALGAHAVSLSKSEQEFFHRLVGDILSCDERRVEATEATNIGRDLVSTTRLSAADANRCLEKLELGQWLAKSDDGFYSLGVRTELQRRYMSDDDRTAKVDADAPSQAATQAVD